jgi:hypothetical protein
MKLYYRKAATLKVDDLEDLPSIQEMKDENNDDDGLIN